MQGADTQRCVNGEQSWPEGSQGAKRHTHRLAASKYLRHSRRAGHDGEGGDRQKGDGEATWRAGRWARRQGGRQLGWGWLPQCQVGMGRLPQHTMPCMLCCCCRPLRVAAGSARLHHSLVVCTAAASEPAKLNGERQRVVQRDWRHAWPAAASQTLPAMLLQSDVKLQQQLGPPSTCWHTQASSAQNAVVSENYPAARQPCAPWE